MNCIKLKEKLKTEFEKIDNGEKKNIEFSVKEGMELYTLLSDVCALIEANTNDKR